jgi:hypothetical protein
MTPSRNDEIIIAQMEEKGEKQVRLLMASGGWPTQLNQIAVKWLREKDQEAERLKETSQSEQAEIARSAKDAAWTAAKAAERASEAANRQAVAAERANTRATIALAIAAISMAATIISIWIAH